VRTLTETEARALLTLCVDDVDAALIDGIRRNDPKNYGSREALLAQLDVLEKVRERLNVRFEWHDPSIN